MTEPKTSLRQSLERTRLAMSPAERSQWSRLACERLLGLPWIAEAQGVALYWPMLARGELDVRRLDGLLRSAGKTLYYPFVEAALERKLFGFRRVEDPSSLAPRGHGFFEPDPGAPPARPGDLDLLVVPALGVSPSGYRLGHGMGFYDAVLPSFRPPARAVAVAFEAQVVEAIPISEHDQPCDLVLTEARVFGPRGA